MAKAEDSTSVLRAAYDVCKYVKQLPFRPFVTDLMQRINFQTEAEGESAHRYGDLGQQGRQARDQFAGYLAAAHRFEKTWGPASGPESHGFLESEELALLQEAHEFLLDINRCLVGEVPHRIPELAGLIDPYYLKGLPKYSGPRRYDLQAAPIRHLCKAFEQHPAWNVISTSPVPLHSISWQNAQTIRSQIEAMTAKIHAVGCAEAPSDIETLQRMARANPNHQGHFRTLPAMVVLKGVLINLDQLIYQAFQYDKLPVLDETSVFSFSSGFHMVGHYTNVRAVPTESTIHLGPGDLVLVKIALEQGVIDSLHCIGSSRISFSQDTGFECEFHMRRVDKNLNCYEGLID
jgi:hypothetical protein